MNSVKEAKFLFCGNRRELGAGAGYILETNYPYLLGKVIKYESYETMAHDVSVKQPFSYAYVPGYNICIVLDSTLNEGGLRLPVKMTMLKEFNNTLRLMAEFYYLEKIEHKKSFYNRYLQVKR